MLKLVMVGENHRSDNLAKIGPAITKLRQGDGSLRLLAEAPFLSKNEKDILTQNGAPKTPGDTLFYFLKADLD
jgi:hypothetical protein